MAVSQAEYAAFKAEMASSAAVVANSIAKMEDFATKVTAEALEAKAVMVDLQASYNTLAAQAAPATTSKLYSRRQRLRSRSCVDEHWRWRGGVRIRRQSGSYPGLRIWIPLSSAEKKKPGHPPSAMVMCPPT